MKREVGIRQGGGWRVMCVNGRGEGKGLSRKRRSSDRPSE